MLANRLRLASINNGIPSDYIAYFTMAGNTDDEAGNYTLTLYNSVVQNPDHLDFDGLNNYGQCDRFAFNDNEFTIVMRFRFDAKDDLDGDWILSSQSTDTGTGAEWEISRHPSDNSGVMRLRCVNSSSVYYAAYGGSVSNGVWYTMAFRFSGSEVDVIDASDFHTPTSFSGAMNTGSGHTRFAARGWTAIASDTCSNVDISTTIAYSRALNDAEVSSVINFIEAGV